MYTREGFEQVRAAAARSERRDTRLLALASIVGGIAQLGLIRWAEAAFARRTAVALEGAVFLVYAGLVVWLLWRLQRRRQASAPVCPQCGARLEGLSERVAVATGHCDRCGGQVLE